MEERGETEEWSWTEAVCFALFLKKDGDKTPFDRLVDKVWEEMQAMNEESENIQEG